MTNGAAVFDTFSIGESLGKVFDKSQTKAIIEAISASRSETVGKAELEAKITKVEANVEKHESKVLHAISAMEVRFDAKIEKSKFDLIKWLIGLLITQSGLLFTVLRFFPKTG